MSETPELTSKGLNQIKETRLKLTALDKELSVTEAKSAHLRRIARL